MTCFSCESYTVCFLTGKKVSKTTHSSSGKTLKTPNRSLTQAKLWFKNDFQVQMEKKYLTSAFCLLRSEDFNTVGGKVFFLLLGPTGVNVHLRGCTLLREGVCCFLSCHRAFFTHPPSPVPALLQSLLCSCRRFPKHRM